MNGCWKTTALRVNLFGVLMMVLMNSVLAETKEILPDESLLEFLGEFDSSDDELLEMALDNLDEDKPGEATPQDLAEGEQREK